MIYGAVSVITENEFTIKGTQMANIPDAEIAMQINVRLEALKQIRAYGSSLVAIQSGFVGASGLLLKTSTASGSIYLGILFAALIISIYFGAVVVAGTVPHIVQKIADYPHCDIYEQTGGIPKGWLATQTLGELCLLQAYLFVGVLALFAIFVLFCSHTA